jgi:hypothetical protein
VPGKKTKITYWKEKDPVMCCSQGQGSHAYSVMLNVAGSSTRGQNKALKLMGYSDLDKILVCNNLVNVLLLEQAQHYSGCPLGFHLMFYLGC